MVMANYRPVETSPESKMPMTSMWSHISTGISTPMICVMHCANHWFTKMVSFSDPADADAAPPSSYFRFIGNNENDGSGPSQQDDLDELEELEIDEVVRLLLV